MFEINNTMEEHKKHHEECDCRDHGGMCCGWGRHGKHSLLKWALLLFILIGAFWIGVKVGELKSLLRSEFGYGSSYYTNSMMQGFNGGYGYPMMNWRAKTTLPAAQ